jgi:PKD repeat protein
VQKIQVIFFNTSTNTYPGGTSYSWNFGDGTPNDTNANPIHLYPTQGTYTITLVASNSTGTASDTAQFTIVVLDCFTGIPDLNNIALVTITPNPVTDQLCISMASPLEGSIRIKLYDPVSNLVVDKILPLQFSRACLAIPGMLTKGIYLAVMEKDGNTWTSKIVIQ